MRNRFFKSVISVVLVLAILFTSNSLLLYVFAEELPVGVGIYNHVMTDADTANTKYIVRFYVINSTRNGFNQVSFPNEIQIGNKSLSPYSKEAENDSASIYLGKDEQIVFSDNPAFINFIKTNYISKIVIDYEIGRQDGEETSVLYSDSEQTFDFWEYRTNPLSGNSEIWTNLFFNDSNPLVGIDDPIKEFDSTLMREVTIEQTWRDRGVGRPELSDLEFDLIGAPHGGEGVTYFDHTADAYDENMGYYAYTVHVSDNPDVTEKDYRTYLKVESPSSNSWLYHYTVPERDAQNNPIEYTSEQFFPEAYADKYKLVTNYEDDPNHYLAIGLTEFTFTMKWADAYDSTARPEVDLKYITDNFTLYMMKDGQEKQVNFLPDDLPDPQQDPEAYAAALEKYFSLSVDEETGITTVTIKHLEDINEEGTANEYYLKQNNANHTLPVNQSAALVDKANDYYDVKTENSGLHASDYYTTYEGGQIELVLTGTTDFSATVEWKDNETAEIRKRDDTAAELSLWRYVGNESAEAAIVKTENVNGAENSTTVNFNGNSKYDLLGNLYTYYAVEKITVEETNPEQPAEAEKLPYAAEYPDNDRMLKNGQTVTNRLSDMVEYSVSADWTAAARQGGVATATYQLQRKTKNASEWEPVMVGGTETPMELNVNFSEHYMSRHGDDSCIFPEVEVYDEDGNRYQYRVVQTNITRTDVMVEGQTPVTESDNTVIGNTIGGTTVTETETIKVNDYYSVTLVREDENGAAAADGTDFHFTYLIQGSTYVRIQKNWVQEDRQTPIDTSTGNYTATFDVQNFNNDAHDYLSYFIEEDYPAGYFTPYIYDETTNHDGYFERVTVGNQHRIVFKQNRVVMHDNAWLTENIPVPRYDNQGREIPYRSVETARTFPPTAVINNVEREIGFFAVYQWNLENNFDPREPSATRYNMTVTNIRTYDRGDYGEISISKEWVDDGELEFRRPIRIIANAAVDGKGIQNSLLKRENVWEDRMEMKVKYKRDENGKRIVQDDHYVIDPENTYSYLPEHFSESPENPVEGEQYYWSLAEINAIKEEITHGSSNLSETEQWIYKLLSTSDWGGAINRDNLNDNNSVDLTEKNGVDFSHFAGIYKSAPTKKIPGTDQDDPYSCHYYAVRQEYTSGGVNDALGTLRFINTRIGVISYEVLFDWNVGEAIQNNTIQNVSLKISGNGLKEDPETHESQITQVIDPDHLVQVTRGGKTYYAYYVLNLPKYDSDGKLIDYRLEEIGINGVAPNADGEIMVGDNRCVIRVGSEAILEGSTARSDDLHSIVISNTFEDIETITVNKTWVDNQNAYKTRSDLYIKLFRISDNPDKKSANNQYPIEQLQGSIDGEYIWTQDAQLSEVFWSYHFDDLPKYDESGYPYTYFVKEQEPERLPNYRQEYDSNLRSVSGGQTVRNPKVYLTDAQIRAAKTASGESFGGSGFDGNFDNVVFDGGTITNRLYGEVHINGIKLWQNVSGLLEKKSYPIADVSLYRDLSELTPEQFSYLLQNLTLTEQEILEKKILIADTTIMNGETNFYFPTPAQGVAERGFVIMSGNHPKIVNHSIVLPKYDELGIALTYKLEEVPINGYASKIEKGSQKLINEYHGGAKLAFSVKKHWDGMADKTVFPTVTMTLYQLFKVDDSTEQNPNHFRYIIMNRFEREIKAQNDSDVTVSFPDANHPGEANSLRYYSPTREPYIYFVTETLSNYDGERVLFIDADKLELIRSEVEGKYDSIIALDEEETGRALGFTSTVTDPLDDPAGVVRGSLIDAQDPQAPMTEEQLDAAVEKYLSDKEKGPVGLDESITNSYRPDAEFFQGKLDVTKEWDTQKLHENDKLEFDTVRSYSFALSRETKQIPRETLFKVHTTDSHSSASAPTFTDLNGFSMTGTIPQGENTPEITAHDFLPSIVADSVVPPEEGQAPKYYIGVLIKGNHAVTVVIDVANDNDTDYLDYHNTVHITGLAVYGHDALKYTYFVTEEKKTGYTSSVIGGNSRQLNSDDNVAAPVVELSNRLDVFDLTLHKAFAKEYDNGDGTSCIEPLSYSEHEQFFNNAYFDQLTFTLYRSSVPTETEPYATVTGAQIRAAANSGTADSPAQLDKTGAGGYSYTFAKLPIRDINGNFYTYWVTETDGAQSAQDPKVYTRYSDAAFVKEPSPAAVNPNPKLINANDSDKDETRDTYCQNVFKAKKIAINKYWLDNNNEDGLRDQSLSVTIYEKNSDATITTPTTFFNLTLEKENAADQNGWHLDAAVARYYYNGTTPENQSYKINEVLPENYTLVEAEGTLGGEGTDDPNTYVIPRDAPVSDTTYRPIGVEGATGNDTIDELNLTNYKKPQKGKVTLNKTFDAFDARFKADTRPDNLYFKLVYQEVSAENYLDFYEGLYTPSAAQDFTDYVSQKVKVKVGGSETYTVTEGEGAEAQETEVPYLNTTTGVITVPCNGAPGYNYPSVEVSNLQMGYFTDAGVQKNGSSYVLKCYKFVECTADGSELPETFPYEQSGGRALSPYFDSDWGEFAATYRLTNLLKKENHVVKKMWQDDANNGKANYYNTRPENIYVSLQRTTDETPWENGNWENVYQSDTQLTADLNSLNVYDDYSANAAFKNLPQYDAEGKRYHYRVVETYIGPNTEDKYSTNHQYTDENQQVYSASKVYYVVYDNDLSDNQTTIDNHLIRKTEYQNFKTEKIWVDNKNQDGKRTPITVVLKQYIKNSNNEEEVKQTLEEELNETNNWRFEWTNYPRNDADGNLYYYDVYEKKLDNSDISVEGYQTQRSDIIKSQTSVGVNSYEERIITNTHTQAESSLSVNKKWLNETEADKPLRPESIEFVLCCQYTKYKYVAEDPSTHEQTTVTTDAEKEAAIAAGKILHCISDGEYDGPVSEATDLLTLYPDTSKNDSYDPDNPQTGDEHIYSITLTPEHKMVDSEWTNAVTFNHLPVYINTCGDSRWAGQECPVTYYVKETQPTLPSGQENPYRYGVTDDSDANHLIRPHGAEGEGTSTDTTLLNGATPTAQTVTASNELKTRDITVTKVWEDNGYGNSLHYDIDFTLTSTGNASGFAYNQTRVLNKDAKDSENQPVLTVEFKNLPKYDKNGVMLQYTVTETVHGGSGATATHQSGYVQSTPAAAVDSQGILTGYTITNTLPVTRFKADKVWNDNNNQDGKRPAKLNLRLTGTAETQTDIDITKFDTSAAHENNSTLWNVDYNVQPVYNVNNVAYDYSITEEADGEQTLASRGYTRYVNAAGGTTADKSNFVITAADTDLNVVTDTTESGVTVKTFHFMNRYTPQKDNLKITKDWQDTVDGTNYTVDGRDYYSWTRPQSVTVALKCTYNNTTVDLTTAESTDPVKALFPSNYQFTRTVTGSGHTWQEIFGDLPLKVNPTGTAVFNGQEYTITYFVEEVPLNGYTTAYSPANGTALNGTDADDEITVTNTLKTKQFRVKKVWDDKGYDVTQTGASAAHYDVNVSLDNTNSGVSYTQGQTITTDNTSATVVFTVPQYVASGDKATYCVTELASDRQYGYVTTYSSDHEFNAVDLTTNSESNPILITNTLPLTEVTVNKVWRDESNAYALRPDSISVKLQRRPVTNNGIEWAAPDEGWTDYDATFSGSNSGNNWSYTYSKLPKFDSHNIEYAYRVTEAKVNAYDTAYLAAENSYTAAVVTKQDTQNNADSTLSFGVENTLIKKNITLKKVWDDDGYPDASNLHYPVTFTVKKPANADFTFSDLDVTVKSNLSWQDSRTVPVYDKNGNPIQYTVTEEKTTPHYGYAQVGGTAVTQEGTHTGNSNYFDTYTITNKLPLTDVTAVKHWAGDVELYPNANATVKVNLTRSSDNTQDSSFNSEKQIVYSNGTSDSVTFDKLLAYDVNNNPYTYTVTEQTVTGYSTAYNKQDVLSTEADADNRVVTITNTPLKSDASFVKYDVTDLEKHGADSRFKLKTLPNAEFELFRELTGNADKQFYATLSNGVYTISDREATGATSTFVTGSDGVIRFTNLEPNRYYLKEKNAPTGYQTNGTKYYFTVSVDAQTNEISVSYDEQPASVTDYQLLFGDQAFQALNAMTSLTDLTAFKTGSSLSSVHGLPDEENLSQLTLTKQDANDSNRKLPNTTYYLLRLYNYEYRKTGAQGSNAEEYLTNALNTLTEDYSSSSPLWTYWEKVGNDCYVTDENGRLTAQGHMFGTYVFYEVKAPTGYERDFTHNATTDQTLINTNVIGPVALHADNAAHQTEVHSLTHLEPRKKAHLNVLKTDENGNPLRGAVFKLYKVKSGEEAEDTLITTFNTGYDGMNPTAYELDCSQYAWNQKFYLLEETPPTGYSADNDGTPERNRIEFTLTPELAEEALHIIRANDARLKGKVTLTKVASARTTVNNAGDPLGGAVFELYTKSGTQLSLYPHTTDTNRWRVAYEDDDAEIITEAGFDSDNAHKVTEMTTAGDGKLHIEGIDWGEFYLKEKTAPIGFKLPDSEDAKKVFFSVGQNNSGDTPQELKMKNDPLAAKLNIAKQVDSLNIDAWGTPTFIFKLRQTERYDAESDSFVALETDKQRTLTKTVSPVTAVAGGFMDETGAFEVEPGAYTVTEVRVARYTAAGNSVTAPDTGSAGEITAVSNTAYTASLTIKPDGAAKVTFFNQLTNYEKLSHTDKVSNRFNGYTEISVQDKDLTLDASAGTDHCTVTVPKSELMPKLIRADGTAENITNLNKLAVSYSGGDVTITDKGTSIEVSGHRDDISGSVFKLSANYDNTFTDEFELRFAANPLFTKTEKTVTFLNDALNRSHYNDNGAKNVYTLLFILEVVPDGTSTTQAVRKILHNGTSTGKTDQTAFPALTVEADYSTQFEFDKWSYSYNNGAVTGTATDAQLLEIIRNAPDNANITVTALLKNKS